MEWLVVAVCLFLNGLLAAAEIAFISITRVQIRELIKAGNHTAETLLRLRENPERTLSVIQVGISLVGALAAAVGGAEAHQSLSPYIQEKFTVGPQLAGALAIAFLVVPLTFFTVIFGELVPKTLALRNPTKIALTATRWLVTLDNVFLPIVDLLEWSTKRVLKIFFPKGKQPVPSNQLSSMVELEGLSSQTRQYILNLVGIEKKRVREVMLAWQHVDHIYLSQTVQDVEAVALRSGHTRLPVVSGEDVHGIVNTKELLALVKSGEGNWSQIVRPISRVNDADTLLKALRQMQEKRSHLSAVYQGQTLVGIVTMEDILEEIIGEIYDEDDDGALRRILTTSVRRRNP